MTSIRHLFGSVVAIALGVSLYAAPAAASAPDHGIPMASGADLHIHNKTGVDVELYIFEDASVHKSRAGGFHGGDLKSGETGTAHVKACHFAVVLFHGNDAYHAEFKDCSVTDITISASNR